MTQPSGLFSLRGRVALVTGATGHLGRQAAFALAGVGANVLVNGRSEARVRELVDEIRARGGAAEAAVFDVGDEKEVAEYLAQRAELPLHVVVNNAYAGGSGSIETSDADAYRHSFEVSVVAAHRVVRAALAPLRRAAVDDGLASVINVASMYGLISPDRRNYVSSASMNPPFYGAAKAALLQWTRYAACEFAADGIRVNAISPGPFPSDETQRADPDFIRRLESRVPLGRVGRAEEIAGPLLFLASSASSYVTGANLVVDGGWTAW